MKTLIRFTLILSLSLSFIGTATATKKTSNSRFYEFHTITVDGKLKAPNIRHFNGRAKVNFDRLLKLKKSFLSNLLSTSKLSVFK